VKDRIVSVKRLIQLDKLDQALGELLIVLGDADRNLSDELLIHQAKLKKLQADRRRGLLSWKEEEFERNQIRFAILEVLSDIPVTAIQQSKPLTDVETETLLAINVRPPSVFISYSHADEAFALQIKTGLRERGIAVRIDTDDLQPGEDIQSFILRSVRDSGATLCIISRKSLLSTWVAMETVNTFALQKWTQQKRFIVAYLDDEFFQPSFRLDATAEIDAKIREIDVLIPRYMQQKLNPEDLHQEKSRLFDLRNNLGNILQRLKGSLCLDLRQPHFDNSIERIVAALKSVNEVSATLG